ncbi:hypothetical protein Rctr85_056 [Virus Rctr85]|nr:hypothetical protein Rctr85_056 [Virus Rctr85]
MTTNIANIRRRSNKAQRYIQAMQGYRTNVHQESPNYQSVFGNYAGVISAIETKMWVWECYEETGWEAHYADYRSWVPLPAHPKQEDAEETRKVAVAYLRGYLYEAQVDPTNRETAPVEIVIDNDWIMHLTDTATVDGCLIYKAIHPAYTGINWDNNRFQWGFNYVWLGSHFFVLAHEYTQEQIP